MYIYIYIQKGKAVPLQAWSGPEGSRKLRFPDLMTTAQDGGKVVSLTHRPPLPPGNTPGTHFCQRLSRPQGHSATKRIMSMKNSSDNIGNRTRDLPVCSVVIYIYIYMVTTRLDAILAVRDLIQKYYASLCPPSQTASVVQWLACWPLAPKFAGSNPAEAVGFLRGVIILSMPSSGGEVKESVPCPSFAACKITQ